jgi:hypothetical protein
VPGLHSRTQEIQLLSSTIKLIFMQTLKTFLVIAIAMSLITFANAQQFNQKLDGPFAITKSFKVNGTCEMCKHRIELPLTIYPGSGLPIGMFLPKR